VIGVTSASLASFGRRPYGRRGCCRARLLATGRRVPALPAGEQRDDEVPEGGSVDDAAVAAYRLSVQAGNPLSERRLAQMFGRTSRRWARARIADARHASSIQESSGAPAMVQLEALTGELGAMTRLLKGGRSSVDPVPDHHLSVRESLADRLPARGLGFVSSANKPTIRYGSIRPEPDGSPAQNVARKTCPCALADPADGGISQVRT
jgi:hypothetical protein